MTPVSLLCVIALASYVALSVRLLRKRPRTALNWTCVLVLFGLTVWSIEGVVQGLPAASPGLVRLFGHIGSVGWCSAASLNLAFVLVFTHRRHLLRKWFVFLPLAALPVLVIAAQFSGRLVADYSLSINGWRSIWSTSVWTPIFNVYYLSFTLLALALVFRFWRKAELTYERKQARIILVALFVATVLGSITDIFLTRIANSRVPELAVVFITLWAGGIYYAVTRYGLMNVTPQAAADDILATMPDALLLLGPDGRFVRTNQAALDLFGYKNGELSDKPADILFAEPATFQATLARTTGGEPVSALELDCRTRDGLVVPVSLSGRVMRDRGGESVGIVLVLHEITKRKQAEAALRESELTYRRVFESSNDAMMLLDSETLLDCNEAALRVFGYSDRDEFLGKHPGEISPLLQADSRESRMAADENIATAFRDGRNFFEWLHQRADGAVFPADVLLTPLDYHGRKVLQATVRDITPRKIAEAEIAQKNVQLVHLNKLKNQFLGMAAHDLRNPLAVVSAASALLLDDAGSTLSEAKKTDFLRRIKNNGEFMLKLIDNLLDVAKIESGQLDLELADGDLCVLIEENLTMNRMLAEKKGIRLDFTPESGLPVFSFDRDKVGQVLNNLISNARKFSEPGTAITVRASRVNGSVVVSVRDQGQGIPAEELDKLFKPFGRTTVRSTAGEKGTGLGLAICRKIVEGHHGRIWAESEPGKGSTFSFALPVSA